MPVNMQIYVISVKDNNGVTVKVNREYLYPSYQAAMPSGQYTFSTLKLHFFVHYL